MLSKLMLKKYKNEVTALEAQRAALFASNSDLAAQLVSLEAANPNLKELPKLKEVLAFGQKRELEMKTMVMMAESQISYIETMSNPDAFESMLHNLRKAGGL